MQQIDKLSVDDIELLKALQAEKQDNLAVSFSPSPKKPSKYANPNLPPEVLSVMAFKNVISTDSRFINLNPNQSVLLLK